MYLNKDVLNNIYIIQNFFKKQKYIYNYIYIYYKN